MKRVPLRSAAEERSERAATWAARLADGLASPSEEFAFQAWLDADPRNGAALDDIIVAWRTVETYAASAEIVALRESALASARRGLRQRGHPSARRQIGQALVAASLVLILVLGGAWLRYTPRVYETGVGERRLIALSDGSKLSLDAATVVKVRYTGDRRQLWLERGRARFEVAHNPLRPFSVTAGDEVVVATGTAFSVELVKKEVRVLLYEGHVMVLARTGDDARRTVTMGERRVPADTLLAPGRELILPAVEIAQAAPKANVVSSPDPVRSLSWESGQLIFEDEPLDLVVERMNRYAATPLVVADASTGAVRISGVFRAGDTEALVQGLSAAFGLKSRSGTNSVILSKS